MVIMSLLRVTFKSKASPIFITINKLYILVSMKVVMFFYIVSFLSIFSSPEPLGSQGELIGWP